MKDSQIKALMDDPRLKAVLTDKALSKTLAAGNIQDLLDSAKL
jgi:hypothetical protein